MKRLDVVEPRIPISSLPYTITQSGSYYVTGNLSIAGWDAIQIQASDVSVDLNGYTLSGDRNSIGLYVSENRTNVSVRNGGLRGFGVALYGSAGSYVYASGISATGNGDGLYLSGGGLIQDSIARDNESIGLYALGAGSAIRTSLAQGNGRTGLYLEGPGSLAESCTVSNNGTTGNGSILRAGIFVGQASRVVGCVVTDNAGSGIVFQDRNYIAENSVFRNGGNGLQNSGLGENRVEANNLVSNTGWGILVGSAGNFIIRNSARGNQLGAFSVVGGNVAPIEVGTISNMASNVSF